MTFDDSYRRIRLAFDHLIERTPHRWDVAPRPPPSKVAQLIDEAGPLAPGLQAYFDCCNGVSVRGDDSGIHQLFSIEDMLRIDTPGFFAISHDGCGDYILVARDLEVGAGAVLFLEHEGCYLSSLFASSLTIYVEDWVAGASPHRNREGLDDPAAQALLRDQRFVAQLGPDGSARVALEYVDPTGKVRYGRHPATGERLQIVPRRKRRRSLNEQ